MKIQFKHQAYQSDAVAAVAAVADCFAGQPKAEGITYRLDPGKLAAFRSARRSARTSTTSAACFPKASRC